MSLKMNGYSNTEWNSSKNVPQKDLTVRGREDFIDSTTFLVGSEDSTSILISSGNYTYNFSCDIPEKCPSSYNSVYGHIKYDLKVVLNYGSKIEEILKKTVHVIKSLDLRPQNAVLKLPVDMEIVESKCFCECWKTPLCLYVNLPQGGFVPGETISVYARLINDGSISLKSISISLIQLVKYSSKIPRILTFKERNNLVQNLCSLAGNEQIREFLERIPVPNCPPSSQSECSILQISYEIEVLVDQAKGKRGAIVNIPIMIGTIPIEVAGSSEENYQIKCDHVLDPRPSAMISSTSVKNLSHKTETRSTPEAILRSQVPISLQEAPFMTSANFNSETHRFNTNISGFKPKYLFYEITEDIEMSPTTMEITKEITIAST